MAKFSGKVGYVTTEETDPGVWEEKVVEKNYYGDIIKNISKFRSSGDINDNLIMSNNISIIADEFVNSNFQFMKYVVYMGVKWNIINVEIRHPKILLTLGGVYNDK